MFNHALDFWRERVPAYFWTLSDGPYPHHVPRGRSNWNDTHYGGGSWYGQQVFNSSTNGVCQETCRDFGHMQMGMASAHYTAETAFIQGVDLWKEEQVRLSAAMEFHSRWLLEGSQGLASSESAPSPSPAPHCKPHTTHTAPGTGNICAPLHAFWLSGSACDATDVCNGAGVKLAFAPTMEVGYHALSSRLKASLPLTEQHLKKQVRNMPDPASQLIFCYETLTHGDALQ